MSKFLMILLCLGVLLAIAMAGTALVYGYTAMIMVGFAAFVVVSVAGWLFSEFC